MFIRFNSCSPCFKEFHQLDRGLLSLMIDLDVEVAGFPAHISDKVIDAIYDVFLETRHGEVVWGGEVLIKVLDLQMAHSADLVVGDWH